MANLSHNAEWWITLNYEVAWPSFRDFPVLTREASVPNVFQSPKVD